ncbi:MAG TPA: ABC transporter permease [Gemmatimonadaceae bacterium]|jgi:putative ABC transport system permease protein|nr:ABC transporter permease [Gemmatimonadaceae bacterium]
MKASRLIEIAGKSILKNKMRTLLTMLGIIIGVGAVIVMVAVGQGAKSEIQRQINSLGTNMLVITPGAFRQGGVSQGAGTSNRLTIEDYEALKQQGLLLQHVSPVVSSFAHIVGGAGNWRTGIQGVSADFADIRAWRVTSGRFFDITDVRSSARVVVLGKTVADNLWPNQDPVGQEVRIGRVPVKVIGVLAAKGQSASGSDQDDVILAPYTTVRARLSRRNYIGQILASTATKEQIPSAEREIAQILRGSHKLTAYDPDDFEVRNQTDLAQAASGTADVMTLLLAAIASISLLVGGIGIMNIMLVSVTERTREIGIRMAIGARGGDVLTQFLVEAIVMSIIGGALGVGLGYVGSSIIEHTMGWHTAIAPAMVALAIGFSAAVGIFFGYYPARKAAALDPIQALRYE